MLSEEFKFGLKIMNATGYYSQTEKQVVYIVLNRFQITRMRNLVHEADPKAYITISEVADVFMKQQEFADNVKG